MLKIIALIAKAVAIIGLILLSLKWLWFFVPWGLARNKGDLGWMTWSYAGLNLLGTLGFCAAIACLTKSNWSRVLTNVFIIAAGTFTGMCFGDPMTRGSYDHLGGVERLEGMLTLGSVGAVVGYLVTLIRTQSPSP